MTANWVKLGCRVTSSRLAWASGEATRHNQMLDKAFDEFYANVMQRLALKDIISRYGNTLHALSK